MPSPPALDHRREGGRVGGMKKILVFSFLLLPTLAFAVSVKLTVRDLPATGAKKGTKLITMDDSRSLTAEEQILVSTHVSADGKKYAKSDKERFVPLIAKLLQLGVLLDEEVKKEWMENPLRLTAHSLQHQFIHQGYALTFIREQREQKGIHVVHLYFFKPDN